MQKVTTILVTGCGGGIGTGIGRILKDSALAEKIVGIDVNLENPAPFIYDECDISARADSPDYTPTLVALIAKYAAALVVPMSEAEIRLLTASKKTEDINGVPLVMANKLALEVGLDKLKTNQHIQSLGMPCPWTMLVVEGAPQELPCIIKDRSGRGGSSVMVVRTQEEVERLTKERPDSIWQEYLEPEEEEYTCGLYGCTNGEVRTIIMRRKLVDGITASGEVVEHAAINELLHQLAKSLELRGSINVQLRLTSKGPMVFEINPRFSSTVVFRHKLGFKDVVWSIEEKLGSLPSSYVPPKTGTKFYKGDAEYIS